MATTLCVTRGALFDGGRARQGAPGRVAGVLLRDAARCTRVTWPAHVMKARARATVSSGRRSLLGPAGVILYVGFPLITLPGRPRLWLWRQSLSLRLSGAAKLSRGNFCCRGNFRKFMILPHPEWNVT
jgi:hypothetical protein